MKKALDQKNTARKRIEKINKKRNRQIYNSSNKCTSNNSKQQESIKSLQKANAHYEKCCKRHTVTCEEYDAAKLALVDFVGISQRYPNNYVVKRSGQGFMNIFFGGKGNPLGQGHGHYVVTDNGLVIYKRECGEKHGRHNFNTNGHLVLADCKDII